MNQPNKVILDTSDEAAQEKTMTLWVSRNGFAYRDERAARFEGCTHRACATDGCDGITEKHYIYCPICREHRDLERYMAMPFLSWDGKTPLCLHGSDQYFFNEDEIETYCEENAVKASDMRLVICKPQHARIVDPADVYENDLPEEGEVPQELQEAFDELNKKILDYVTPLCWVPGKYRTKLED